MLQKCYSHKKKKEIIDNIKNFNSDDPQRHNKRLYTIGFLYNIGYTTTDIKNILLHYNPSLENDMHYKKYISEYYIKFEVLYYGNKNVVKEEPSQIINAKRSVANISLPLGNTKERYDMIPLNDLNKSFFDGANIIAFGYVDRETGIEKYNIHGNFFNYNPVRVPVYRSIGGIDHVLFVADIDKKQHGDSLEQAKEYAKMLSDAWDWDIIKFSGSEGYHLIKYLPKDTTIEDLRSKALEFDPGKDKLDWCLFNDLNWKIRGYCVNLKTMRMSENVDL